MADYDMGSLSPYEFELLALDILSNDLNLKFESFSKGRDNGIDLRHSENLENNIIVQCKHYINSSYSSFISVLKKEVEKVKKLNPNRYILVTSLSLTPNRKTAIAKILSPYLKDYNDIYDRNTISTILNHRSEILDRHYKLWFLSADVLKKIINSNQKNKQMLVKEVIVHKLKVYVQNESFELALKMLQTDHMCLISGEPGIGKTTLAEMLALFYQERGYELNVITHEDEFLSIFDEEKKQVFMFDDFLGNVSLKLLEEEKMFEMIVNHIGNKNKRLILTTREYILNEAEEKSETIRRQTLKRCVIKQENYTKLIRAQILYNHVYHSELTTDYHSVILENKNYLRIINHKNYNPRIIETMTNIIHVKRIPAEKYIKEFIDILNNPEIIWKIAFETGLSEIAQEIVLLLGLTYRTIGLKDFKNLYKEFHNKENLSIKEQISMEQALRQLSGNFINLNNPSDNTISFVNPSVQDFIRNNYKTDLGDIVKTKYLQMKFIYWDQYIIIMEMFKDIKKSFKQQEVYKCISEMLHNLDYPNLEIYFIHNNRIVKRPIEKADRIYQILKYVKEYKIDDTLLLSKITQEIEIMLKQPPKIEWAFESSVSWYIDYKGLEGDTNMYNLLISFIENCNDMESLAHLTSIIRNLYIASDYSSIVKKKIEEIIDYADNDYLAEFENNGEQRSFQDIYLNMGIEEECQITEWIMDKVEEAKINAEQDNDDSDINIPSINSQNESRNEDLEIENMFTSLFAI